MTPTLVKPASSVPAIRKVIPRTSAGLRDALFDEIDSFRRGEGDPQRAMAISKLAAQILAAAKVEHEVTKFKGADGYNPEPLQLGSEADE